MKKQMLALFALLLLTSVSLYSQEYPTQGIYAGAVSGLNLEYFQHNSRFTRRHFDTEPGYQVGGSLGYKFCNNIRVEGEVSYRRNNFKHFYRGHRELITCMANAFYDFDTNSEWTPYLGMGIGYAHARGKIRPAYPYHFYDVRYFSFAENMAAWQGIAGISYRLTCSTEIGVEYRILLAQEKSYNHLFAISLREYF